MKCPACQTDSKKSDRPDGACPQCRRPFRLDPAVHKMSDYAMEAILTKVTENRTLKYVNRQLIAAIERRLLKQAKGKRLVAIAFLVVGTVLLLFGVPFAIVPMVIIGLVLGLLGVILYFTAGPTPGAAADLVRAYGETPLLVAPKPAHAQLAAGAKGPRKEFDLESYGFDRVIVVQGDDLAEMLIANQFHFQHNAAIVSLDGYPTQVAGLVDRYLQSGAQAASGATIVLLHDASLDGYGRATHWVASRRLHPSRIIRAGLTPRQAGKLTPVMPIVGAQVPAGLRPADAAWLAKNAVSAAALRPAQLMTLLFNAIQRKPQAALAVDDGSERDYLIVASDGFYDFG
jgi:hypothetical protein